MTHCELAVQISASKSKYYRELMRFQNSLFSRFYMKIEKALELFYFRKIFKLFELDLFVLVYKRVERWVFIKFVFGLEIIRDFRNFSGDFVWKIESIENSAEKGLKHWKSYLRGSLVNARTPRHHPTSWKLK